VIATTRWSLVLAARGDSPDARTALDALCRAYRPVVLAHLRRHGDPAQAEDATQAFFVHFLEARLAERAERPRGAFRAFLFTALENHRRGQLRAQAAGKRSAPFVDADLDAQADALADPAKQFDRDWALRVVERARAQVHDEARRAGKDALFVALQPFLGEAPDASDYARVGATLGLSPNAVAAAVRRLRERVRSRVRRELADTLPPDADLDAELGWLRQALRD
jgi:RNA polymerase sigma-70 factor (ECF subfamily)